MDDSCFAELGWRVAWEGHIPGMVPLLGQRDIVTEVGGHGIYPTRLSAEKGPPLPPLAANHIWAVQPEPSRVPALICVCGSWECSPRWVTITGDADQVEWDLSSTSLGAPCRYTFAREQYDKALSAMLSATDWETPRHRLARLVREAVYADPQTPSGVIWQGSGVRESGQVIVAAALGERLESLLVAPDPADETLEGTRLRAGALAVELVDRLQQDTTPKRDDCA